MHAIPARRVPRIVLALIAAALTSLLIAVVASPQSVEAAARAREANERYKLVRWDIAKCNSASCNALVVGGRAYWRAQRGARISFTGTGQAEPREGEAAGGGLWTRRTATGRVIARGTYTVVGFISWKGYGGTLGNVADAIGSRNEVRSGLLELRIRLFSRSNRVSRGRLVIASDSGGPTVPGRSHLVLHTAGGTTIKYFEGRRLAKGQTLLHHIR